MPTPSPPSAMFEGPPFAPDPPLQQDASYSPGKQDRAYQDSQAVGAQKHLCESLINGLLGTWVILDPQSAGVAIGNVVCLAGTEAGTVTLATASALAAAGSAYGICMIAANPGGPLRVARYGIVPPSITGLPTVGNSLYAKVNTSNATVATAASLLSTDYPLGTVDGYGNLNLAIQFTPLASSAPAWLTPVLVTAPAAGTATSGKMMWVKAGSGVSTITPPALSAGIYWGVCDGAQGGSFNASHGANVTNASSNIEDPSNPGVYTNNPIQMRSPSQSAIWMCDPGGVFFKLIG